MSRYFNNMHTYHIAYAAFPNENKKQPGYLRARRYMASGLKGTGLKPDYEPEGFFKTGEPYRITVIKWENHIYFKVNNAKDSLLCYWHNKDYPPIIEGRIGLINMFTRAARYSDFSIYVQK